MVLSSPRFCTHCGAANTQQAAFCFACGQPISDPQEPEQSDMLSGGTLLKDRYRILSTLGKGGMGSVYKAEDTLFANRPVAVKEMRQAGLNAQQKQTAAVDFKREAHMLAGLHHPNLPTIHDYFSEQGQWYLVMDFIAGETLEERLSKTPNGWLPLNEALDIGLQLCAVLNYLHTRQPAIVFRDLKPANVMCSPAGNYFLIDFGIARHFKPGQFKDTVAFGSMGYAAPEQYGKSQTTPRSDIYSLGVILHQCLSGHDPTVNSPTPFDFPPLELHGQIAPQSLFTLISQMLTTDPQKRPPDMAAVLHILNDFMQFLKKEKANKQIEQNKNLQNQQAKQTLQATNNRSLQATFAPAPRTPVRSVPAKPAYSSPQPVPPTRPTRKPIHIISYQATCIACAPRTKRLATGTNHGQVQIWDLDSLSPLATLPGSNSAVGTLQWSPTEQYLAAGDEGGLLIIWNVVTRERVYSYRGYAVAINTLAWSPDGTRIASGDSHGRVLLQGAFDGGQAYMYLGHIDSSVFPLAVRAVAWSPDGESIASGDSAGHIRRWDVHNPETNLWYDKRMAPVTTLAYAPDGKHIASAHIDGNVCVWDAGTGNNVYTYKEHKNIVTAIAWSLDGKRIASGSRDRTIHVWGAFDGSHPCFYVDHTDPVTSLAWHPDKQHIISASTDKTLCIW